MPKRGRADRGRRAALEVPPARRRVGVHADRAQLERSAPVAKRRDDGRDPAGDRAIGPIGARAHVERAGELRRGRRGPRREARQSRQAAAAHHRSTGGSAAGRSAGRCDGIARSSPPLDLHLAAQGDELVVRPAVAREVEHRSGRLLRRHAFRHEIGQHRDRHDQRPARAQRLQPAERRRAASPARSAPAAAVSSASLALAAERLAGAAELPVQRHHRRDDALAARAEGAALERLLHQRLGGKTGAPRRIHHLLHAGGRGGVQPLGEPGILRGGGRREARRRARRERGRRSMSSAHREHGDRGAEVALRRPGARWGPAPSGGRR